MLKIGKILLPVGIYFILGALVFHRALDVGFLCDDAMSIALSLKPWFSYGEGSYQFLAPAYAINYTLFQLFHLNPVPYHAFHLLWIVVNAALTKALAENLAFKPWQAWVAGLLALFNSVASEAYFFYAVFPTIMMTTLVLVGLLCLARFRLTGAGIWRSAYLGIVLFAPLMESKGVILPLLGYFLDRCWVASAATSWKSRIFSGWTLHLTALGLMGSTLLLRSSLGVRAYVINLPPWEKYKTFRVTLVSTFFHGLDDHLSPLLAGFQLPGVYIAFWIVLLALLLWGWVLSPGSERRRFLVLLLAWMAASLPHTLAANIQFRYFYLPGVFAALMLVELLGCFSCRLRQPRNAYLLVALIVLGYLAMDLRGFHYSLDSFQEASRIYNAGLKEIKKRVPVLSPDTRLVLIDFPDKIYSRQGQSRINKYYIYVYRSAFPYQLHLIYGTEEIDVSLVRLSSPSNENPLPLGEQVTRAKVSEMLDHPQALAIRYLPNPPRFVNFPETGGD